MHWTVGIQYTKEYFISREIYIRFVFRVSRFFGKFAFLQFRFKRSINSVWRWRWRTNCLLYWFYTCLYSDFWDQLSIFKCWSLLIHKLLVFFKTMFRDCLLFYHTKRGLRKVIVIYKFNSLNQSKSIHLS